MAGGDDRAPFLDWAVAWAALPGETASGDVHVVRAFTGGALVAVVDGLGHGDEAASAARRAAAAVGRHTGQSVITLVRHCHQELVGTRGVAMSLAQFDPAEETMTWLAIGNVDGVLLRADPQAAPGREAVVMRGGVVGYDLPPLRASVTTVSRGDLLVFATDGIRPGFTERVSIAQPAQRIADDILAGYGKGTDDALVLVARYLGAESRDS